MRNWRRIATVLNSNAIRRVRIAHATGTALVVAWLAAPALAQLPSARLISIYPPGGQQGTQVEVSINGVDLDEVGKLHFSHPGITAQQKMTPPSATSKDPQPIPNQFVVAIAADVPPGIYEARAVGFFGTTNPRAFVVSDRPEVLKKDGNNSVKTAMEVPVGSIVTGRAAASNVDHYKFAAKAGQRVIIDCVGRRIDAKLDATLILCDAQDKQLAVVRDTVGVDPRIDFTAPADGEYIVKLHDCVYGGGEEYVYRLAFSSAPQIDFVMPPAGVAGTTSKFTLYGRNLPGGAPVPGVKVDGANLEQLAVDIALPAAGQAAAVDSLVEPRNAALDAFEYRLKGPQGTSNPVPIGFATAPVVIEQEPNAPAAKAQKVTVPCEYVGQFYPQRDYDWITFDAKKGDQFFVEVYSQRMGLATDPSILVQQVKVDDKGMESVTDVVEGDDLDLKFANPAFDNPSNDAAVQFTAAADGTYRVLVRDLSSNVASPRDVYRLAIRKAQPDFQLLAVCKSLTDKDPQKINLFNPVLRKGEATLIRVHAFRRDGFNDPITLTAQGLPAGVTCRETTIPAGEVSGVLCLDVAADAADAVASITIVGKAKIGEQEIVRQARNSSLRWDTLMPNASLAARLTKDLSLSVIAESAPLRVEPVEAKVWATARGGKITVPLKVARSEGSKGDLKLDPVGLPAQLKGAAVTVAEKGNAGNFEVTVEPAAKAGTYTCYLTGTAKFAYSRNPEAAKRADAAKQEFAKVVAQLAETAKTTDAAKQVAEKLAADTAAAAKAATAAAADTAKKATDAEAAAKAAAEKATQAKAALDKAAGDAGLTAALAAADKASADAAAAAKAAVDANTAAQTAATQATEAATKAEAAKVESVKVATEAAEKSKAAVEQQKVVDKKAADLAEAAKPKDIDTPVLSIPMVIQIADSPINLKITPPPAAVKQGEKVEIAVAVERLFGFADEVELEIAAPQGVAGLKIDKIKIPADQAAGKIIVEAAKEATPGTHQLVIKNKLKFNGQALEATQNVPVTVEKAAAQ